MCFALDFQREIGKTVIQLQDDIQELLRRTKVSTSFEDGLKDLDGAPLLPLETVDDLSVFNIWLEDLSNKEKLV